MKRRITISIPDHVAELVEEHRESINISSICAEALERRCRTLRKTKQKGEAIQMAVSRYRAQHAEILSESKEVGFEMGADFILRESDLATARKLARLYHDSKDTHLEVWDSLTKILRQDWVGKVHDLKEIIEERDLDFDDVAEGFLEGVMDVWPKIEAELD